MRSADGCHVLSIMECVAFQKKILEEMKPQMKKPTIFLIDFKKVTPEKLTILSTLELQKVEIYLSHTQCEDDLLGHIKPSKVLVLDKQFSFFIEELDVELGAQKSEHVCVRFFFKDRYFQWRHQFQFKPEVLEEVVSDGVLLRCPNLQKAFIGDEELESGDEGVLLKFSRF